jgi:hypothetical protein
MDAFKQLLDNYQTIAYHFFRRRQMEFISIREFNASPAKTRNTLKKSGRLVITNNGKPSMLVLDIRERDFEETLDLLNRAEALKLLDQIQAAAVRGGLQSMSQKQIDAEISAARRTRRKR